MSVALLVALGLPLAGAAVLPLLGARWAVPLASAASAGTLGLLVALAAGFDLGRAGQVQDLTSASWITSLHARFAVGIDGVNLPLLLLTAVLTLLCCLYTAAELPEPGRPQHLLAAVLLLESGVLTTFASFDLLLFFIAFEVVLVPMYFLIAIWGGAARRHAAMKFVLYTLLGSALLLLGVLVIASHAHTLDMRVLARRHGAGLSRGTQDLAFVALFLAFAVKSPLWPLHSWLPDAHTEAPTVGSVLLAGVLLKMGTFGLIRIAVPELPLGARDGAPALAVLATVAIVYGALCCLAQRDAKRLIAYSSVGHMGFVLLGIATLTPLGLDAALFGNVAHGVITGLLFFLVGGVKARFHTADIGELGGGLRAKLPGLAGLLILASIASLGLPGLAGFWGEVLALFASYHPGAGLPAAGYRVLMAAGFLGTLLAAGYFLWLVRRVALGSVAARWRAVAMPDITAWELVAWAPLVVFAVGLGLWPRLLLAVTHPAVLGLLR
ncbi:MAG: complex I subunit 4 family protein [Mycobacteriales bacterium]